MDVEASPEVGAASEATQILEAPQGWQKKVVSRIGGTSMRRDVVFVAPNGEEMRSKRQLKRYLKANTGSPPLSDFDWSTGETPRRSERLSARTRKSVDSPNAAPPAKRAKKKTPAKKPKEDDEDTEVNPLEEGTPTEEKDDEMLDANPSEVTPPVAAKEFKETDAEHFEVPALARNSEAEEIEGKHFEEAVPLRNFTEDKETESKTSEVPSPAKNLKGYEAEEELSKDGLVDELKKEEIVETTDTESNLLEITKEDADTEMQDPAPVTDDHYEEVVIKEEITLIVESTVEIVEAGNDTHTLEKTIESEPPTNEEAANEDLEFGEAIEAGNGAPTLDQTFEFMPPTNEEAANEDLESGKAIEAGNGAPTLDQTFEFISPTNEEAANEDLESGENKKDAIKDGEQDATNATFAALEIPGQDEHVEEVCTESDHAKPEITPYLNVNKPQEAHPAEVGVSS